MPAASPRTLRYWIATGKLSAIPGKRGKLVRLGEVRRLAVLVGKEPLAGNLTGNSATSADMVAGNAAESVARSAPVSDAARQQLAMVRDEWLAPLVAQITEQAERIGRLEGESTAQQEMLAELRRQRNEDRERERTALDELRRRAEVAEAKLEGARLRLAEVDVPPVVVVAGPAATEAPHATTTTPAAQRPAQASGGVCGACCGRVSRMRRSPVEDLYAPLSDYLARQAAAGQRQAVLPFAQVEVTILGRPLPPRARTRRDWWQNDGGEPHTWHGWLRAGWFVGTVSLATETAILTRGGDDEQG